jgi:hypothetical protein
MALKRTRYKMPDFIRDGLNERILMDAYRARLAYQQNEYIGSLCFTLAKQETTMQKIWIKSWMNSIAGAWT